MTGLYFALLAALTIAAFVLGSLRARALRGGTESLHSLPTYHGLYLATAVFATMMAIYVVVEPLGALYARHAALAMIDSALAADPLQAGALLRDIVLLANGTFQGGVSEALRAAATAYASATTLTQTVLFGLGLVGGFGVLLMLYRKIDMKRRARNLFERLVTYALLACSAVAVLTTVGIVVSVLFETLQFFSRVSPIEFLFGLHWSPTGNAYGMIPLILGTLLITLIAMAVAGPLGLLSAIYMAEYATPRTRAIAKPILEILAGIPTVVLGFFAALTVAPIIRKTGFMLGLDVASESALAAGLVMGMMIIPFVSSLSDDVINAVPQSLRDGSYAMGATKSETIKKVVLPAALPGIVSAFMLAISRAIGETMIVVMAAGLAAKLTFNPLAAVTTVTVQIKTLLVGDQEFDSAKTLSAFALGFVLFFFTLALNYIALRIVQRYREQYD
jgi:phosphate transport system permease protein